MPESLPSYATLSTENVFLSSSLVSITTQSSVQSYRASNLWNPLRSRRWRSTSRNQQRIVGRFKTPSLPRVVALIDSNLAPGAVVTLELASTSSFNVNRSQWDLPVYEQGPTRTLRWYPGDPDSGSPAAGRSYFRVTLPANATLDSSGDGVPDSYHELGVIWMSNAGPSGSLFSLPIELGVEREVLDPSVIAMSNGGAAHADIRSTYVAFSVEAPRPTRIPVAPDDDGSTDLLRALREVGTHTHVLFDAWGWATDPAKKADGCIYGLLNDRGSVGTMTRRHHAFDTASLRIVEARA